jgi:hypothetical protein
MPDPPAPIRSPCSDPAPGSPSSHPAPGSVPRWGSVADPETERAGLSTAPSVGLVGADAIGPEALLNAAGTRELATGVPTLVVATALKLVPGEVFERLGGPGFEVVPLGAVAAVVVGAEVLSPAEAGRRARELTPGPAA